MRYIHTAFIHTLGGVLVLIGLAGIVLPIVPGILFLALGMYVMSLRSSRIKQLLDRFAATYPRLGGMLHIYAYPRRRNHGHGSL